MLVYIIMDSLNNPISDRLGVINCVFEDKQDAINHVEKFPNLKIVTVNTRPKAENYWEPYSY